MLEKYEDLKIGEKGIWISIAAYIGLAVVKIIAAGLGHSEGLKADGLNNLSDVIGNAAILAGLIIARKPPDEDHRYGHFRAETIASLFASFFMFFVGGKVLYDAFRKFFSGEQVPPDWSTAWVALLGAVVMLLVFRLNFRLAKKINSQGLLAASYDNLSDALVSVGALIGIIGARFRMPWLDPLAAAVVGLVILKTAWDIFRQTLYFLSDGFDQKELRAIHETVRSIDGVLDVKSLRARMLGNRTFVDITISVNPELSIKEGHDIADLVEETLAKKHHITYAHIHIEPETEKGT
ncbi:cation diffusion facilitator family transporter [Caldibacillus debilis]|jgi:cation diffusion facilitator family transporter|uniref:Cation diffusion facilitator family transporter n=2 Tax=Caldibacillus debilis TaxID=301148 RepID=A0A420VJY3_9BACI|nr:cation diffusion facilitator family transporter [Caldibacillus debilis]KYD20522.1 hypothetical protein B4135_1823 [Caldibacillus debilis]RKO63992.1 cation diffusion facilitator family transporter [Caldibacillus debilis GB1]